MIKYISRLLITILLIGAFALSIAGCSSKDSDPEPAKETENASEPAETEGTGTEDETGVISFENFTGGVLLDAENGDHAEITSMQMTGNGYEIGYNFSCGHNGGGREYYMEEITVNGVKYADSVNVYDEAISENTICIEKEWLDTLGITEVKSLYFNLEIGYTGGSSYYATTDKDFMLYTGAPYTDPYEPELSGSRKVLVDTDEFQIILMDGYFLEHSTWDVEYLYLLFVEKTRVNGYVQPVTVSSGDTVAEFYTPFYRTGIFQLNGPGNAQLQRFGWDATKGEMNTSDATLTFQYLNYGTGESQDYTVNADISGYPMRQQ